MREEFERRKFMEVISAPVAVDMAPESPLSRVMEWQPKLGIQGSNMRAGLQAEKKVREFQRSSD